MPSFDDSSDDIGVLGHELLHLTYSAMEHVEIKLTDSSEEAFAYYLGSMMSQALTFLRK